MWWNLWFTPLFTSLPALFPDPPPAFGLTTSRFSQADFVLTAQLQFLQLLVWGCLVRQEEDERWSREFWVFLEQCMCGGGLSLCGRILAVRRHEDDRLGCHSPPLLMIGCDVPRWTSAQPGRPWLGAPPVGSDANTNCTISCFRGRTAALLALDVCLSVIWLLLRCLQGLFAGNCTASVCFLSRKSAQQITPKL